MGRPPFPLRTTTQDPFGPGDCNSPRFLVSRSPRYRGDRVENSFGRGGERGGGDEKSSQFLPSAENLPLLLVQGIEEVKAKRILSGCRRTVKVSRQTGLHVWDTSIRLYLLHRNWHFFLLLMVSKNEFSMKDRFLRGQKNGGKKCSLCTHSRSDPFYPVTTHYVRGWRTSLVSV